MPSYKVLESGFYNSRLYSPEGKRRILHTDKPFPFKKNKDGKNTKVEHVPSWLKRIRDETVAQAKKRETVEKKTNAAAVKKAADDKKEIDEASFMGTGEKSDTVETL